MFDRKIDAYQSCPCGSGKKYKFCCREKEKLVSQEPPARLVRKASEYPVYECLINENWRERGLATLFISRQLPNRNYIFGVYLVDVLCLGLKNTFFNANVSYGMIEAMLDQQDSDLVSIGYEDARSLILGAVEYAGELGFEPNSDWADSKFIIEHEREFEPKFEFGENGKPLYIQGPDDDAGEILTKLKKAKSRGMGVFKRRFGKKSSEAIDFDVVLRPLPPKVPAPESDEEWLAEIVEAYREAAKTKPFGVFVGRKITPKDYFHLAPAVCFKFRGISRKEGNFEEVTETVLGSHVANLERLPDVLAIPQMAFAFAYLVSHFALEVLDEVEADRLMQYMEAHQQELISRAGKD